MTVDKGAVGGIQIVDDNIAPAQKYFAMVAGNGAFRNWKCVVIDDPMVVLFTAKS